MVDDGSTDDSVFIAEKFCNQDKRIKIYKQSQQGACRARNYAFKVSKGDYVNFMDADDVFHPEKIQRQIQLAQQFGAQYLYSCQCVSFLEDIPKMFPQKTAIDRNFEPAYEWLEKSWHYQAGQTGIWLTSRALVLAAGEWDETLPVNQDGEFFFRVILNSKGVKFADNAFVFYRRNVSGSISKSLGVGVKKLKSLLNTYKKYEEVLKLNDDEKMRNALSRNYATFIYAYGNIDKALTKQAWKSMRDLKASNKYKIGSKAFRWLSSTFGFPFAMKLKNKIAS